MSENVEHYFSELQYRDLMVQLKEDFGPEYLLNDRAHQWDHVSAVAERALDINEQFELGYDRRMVVIPALLHDLFTRYRNIHHTLIKEFLLTTDYRHIRPFTASQRKLMAEAAYTHRASYTGTYPHILCELIATADREPPRDIQSILVRAWKYAEKHHGGSRLVIAQQVVNHMREKFSTNGYAKYPDLYLRKYNLQLQEMRTFMDHVDVDTVMEMVEGNT